MTYALEYAPLGWSYEQYLAYLNDKKKRFTEFEEYERRLSRAQNAYFKAQAEMNSESPCSVCEEAIKKIAIGMGITVGTLMATALAVITPPEPVKPIVVESTISKIWNSTLNFPSQAVENLTHAAEQVVYAAEVTAQLAAVTTMVAGTCLLVNKCMTPQLKRKAIQFVGNSSLWVAKKSFNLLKATLGGMGTVVKNVAVAALSH